MESSGVPPSEHQDSSNSNGNSITLISLFDAQCRDYGDHDAVVFQEADESSSVTTVLTQESARTATTRRRSIGWSEIQYASVALSRQLYFRFERPDLCLVDCGRGNNSNNAAAELVAVTACIRLGIPFVPVEVECSRRQQHGRLQSIVDTLRRPNRYNNNNSQDTDVDADNKRGCSSSTVRLAAIVVAERGDADPAVAALVAVGVHHILYLTTAGDLLEPMTVPEYNDTNTDNDDPIGFMRRNGNSDTTVRNDNLYVLFTSGTSGNQPKAVVGSHRSTLARLQWFHDQFPAVQQQQQQVIARRTPLTFVDGVNELLAALVTPACQLCCYNNDSRSESLPAWIVANGTKSCDARTTTSTTTAAFALLTRITLLPSQLEQVLLYLQTQSLSHAQQSSLELVIVSGEPCPASLVHNFHQCPYFSASKTRLLNFYGQTETTGDCCWMDLTTNPAQVIIVDGMVPIGRPLPSVTLTQNNQTQEIIVSGPHCLANGYYSHNDSTTAFASDSLATGDVGFYVASNDCWYVRGRVDQIIKINGVLTSPTEVEHVLRQVFFAALPTACIAAVTLDGNVYAVIETTSTTTAASTSTHTNSAGDWFSREQMQESGIPYNLIPRQVWAIEQIPRQTGGATKVDVNRLREWVRLRLLRRDSAHKSDGGAVDNAVQTNDDTDPFLKVVASVLNVSTRRVVAKEESMSFVELGGDSALAVTLLYQFQSAGLLVVSSRKTVTAYDILESSSVRDLRDLIRGTRREVGGGKRMKTAELRRSTSTVPSSANFRPDNMLCKVNKQHATFSFAACVDAAPLVHKGQVYGACQGGVVQRIHPSIENESSIEYFRLGGQWKVQADVTVMKDVLIVCAYNPENETGNIVALSLDLTTVFWRKDVNGMVKSAPVFVNGCVFVHAGNVLQAFDLTCGTESAKLTLPASSESTPVVNDNGLIVYAFSDWDAGLVLLDASTSHTTTIAGVSAPIYANLLRIGDDRVVAADIFGFVHDLNTKTRELQSHKITTSPIFSSPILVDHGKSVAFGSHDGIIRCVSSSNLSAVLWTFNARAVVYARLCEVSMNSGAIIAACTTAGKVIIVGDGTEISSYRVDAEIWSGPVQVREETDPGTITFAFGARDSKLHFVNMKRSNGVREQGASVQEVTIEESHAWPKT